MTLKFRISIHPKIEKTSYKLGRGICITGADKGSTSRKCEDLLYTENPIKKSK